MGWRGGWVAELDIEDFSGVLFTSSCEDSPPAGGETECLATSDREVAARRVLERHARTHLTQRQRQATAGREAWFSPMLRTSTSTKVAGHVVRASSDAERGGALDSPMPTMRDRLRVRGRCAAGDGGASERLAKYGLRLHPEKTTTGLVRTPTAPPAARTDQEPSTSSASPTTGEVRVEVLGGPAQDGSRSIHSSLRAVYRLVSCHRHLPIGSSKRMLGGSCEADYAYYGIMGNARVYRIFYP